ncbi:MAG: TIGR03032 family protein [Planctomycetaceae bacterium]|nr:TIGR03032 family protein [Planctomycetaceae bacterium]
MANDSDDQLDDDEPHIPEPKQREVKYEHSRDFVSILEQLSSTLLISTYQAGKLVVAGVHQGQLELSFHNFEQAMGIAVGPRQIAVGSKGVIWIMRSAPDIARRLEPSGRFDGCFLARTGYATGELHGHEMAWVGDELIVVNTLFSCICTVSDSFSFLPRWRPPFISSLAAEDRCHLNGMAMVDGAPRYVTMMAETDTSAGWRPNKVTTGLIMEVPTGKIITRGLAMPHSPRVYQGQLFVLDSGHGRLTAVEANTGRLAPVAALPGYTRGLAFHGPYAFVGLSKIREKSTFGGVPIAEDRAKLKCGVGVIHLPTGRLAAHFEFVTGVEEIFDVQLIPNVRNAAFQGPSATSDGHPTIWSVPLSARDVQAASEPVPDNWRAPWKR